jgi:hypothetical protein
MILVGLDAGIGTEIADHHFDRVAGPRSIGDAGSVHAGHRLKPQARSFAESGSFRLPPRTNCLTVA